MPENTGFCSFDDSVFKPKNHILEVFISKLTD